MKKLILFTAIFIVIFFVLVIDIIKADKMAFWLRMILEIVDLFFFIYILMFVRGCIQMAKMNRPKMTISEIVESGEFEESANDLQMSMRNWSFKERIKFIFGLCGN